MQSGQDIAASTTFAGTSVSGSFAAQLRASLREHAAAYLVVAALVAATLVMSFVRGEDFVPFLLMYGWRAVKAMLIVVPAVMAFVMVASLLRGDPSPLGALRAQTQAAARSGLLARAMVALCAFTAFMAAFLFNKMLIPDLVPFQWDAAFAEIDRLLFGGVHPWQLLHPLLGHPPVTVFLDMMYSFWVALTVIFWLAAAVSRAPAMAGRRYLLSSVLSWIVIGLVMATLLSSAGPCYFPLVAGGADDPYVGLNAYLGSVGDVHALSSDFVKAYLWDIHSGRLDEPGGISAMPSMHNAQAVLFVLFAYRLNRRLGHVMAAYAAIIFIGSIHLAWHYAVDGIVGGLAALAIWRVTAMMLLPADAEGGLQRPNTSRA